MDKRGGPQQGALGPISYIEPPILNFGAILSRGRCGRCSMTAACLNLFKKFPGKAHRHKRGDGSENKGVDNNKTKERNQKGKGNPTLRMLEPKGHGELS